MTIVDASAMSAELSPAWQRFAATPGYLSPPRVTMVDGRAVAIGALERNSLHPCPVHFRWRIAAAEDAGHLPLLLDRLTNADSSFADAPVHVSVSERDAPAVDAMCTAGFVALMRTKIGLLPPGAVSQPLAGSVHCLADHDTDEVRRQLADLHERVYRAAHAWNPPVELTTERAMALFLDPSDLLPEHLWYAVDADDRPVGIASLRPGRFGRLELGWTGVEPPASQDIHLTLIDMALSGAQSIVVIEMDENQIDLTERLRYLPVRWLDTITRYERPPRSAHEEITTPC